jgi:hypothetical protein
MARPSLKIIGQLRHSESGGVQFSFTVGKKGQSKTAWVEVLPNAMDWPGIEKTNDIDAYLRALHADSSYRAAAGRFAELQQLDPQPVLDCFWAFRGAVYWVDREQGDHAIEPDMARLLVKHHVLRRDRDYQRIRREVEALENLEKIEGSQREPIPEAVRLFVWQRDKGRCVKCGSQERLEFDHIIPVASGGSNTERNIQLLCEVCNRSKGATI